MSAALPRTPLRLLLALLGGVLTVHLTGVPAQAHPFGDPQTLEIARWGDGVAVTWQAAEDDVTSLALRLGAVQGRRAYVYRDGAMVPKTSETDDAAALAASPHLADYLLANIRVSQEGAACAGELIDASELASAGATVEYLCPEPVEEVEVAVTMLLDIHSAYRTAASGPGGAAHVFSAQSTEHAFTLVEGADVGHTTSRGALTLLAWGGLGLAVLVAVPIVVRRVRRTPA